MGPPKILKPGGGDWKNAFNPEIFKKKVADLKEEASKKTVPDLDEDSKKTDEKIAFLKKGSTVKDVPNDSKAGPSQKKTDLKNPNFKNADESIAAIMKMVEDEKVNDELKRAKEEVESYRYPNETVAEFEKNIVFRHNDNVTQWVNEFSKKRGWFVQYQEVSGAPGGRHRATATITIKHIVVQGISSKKKEAKNQAYKNMSTRLGEVLKKLKPQPGTDLLELNKVIEKMRDYDPSDDRRRERSRSLRRARSRSAQRRRSDHAEARRRRSSSRGRRSRSRTRRNSRRSSSRSKDRKRSRSSRRKSKSKSKTRRKSRSKSRTKRKSRSRSKTIKKERRSRSRSTPITVGKSYWDA